LLQREVALIDLALIDVWQDQLGPGVGVPEVIAPAIGETLVGVMEAVAGKGHLLEIVGALRARRRLAHLLHGRHQEGDQNGDDGDHHQQFDQCERTSTRSFHGEPPIR
jgi:hypothetical protein